MPMPKRKSGSKRTVISEASELTHIIIATAVTTLIFAYNWRTPAATIAALPLSFLAVVTAFVFHELAHRFAARKLNCWAEYRLWVPGIIFGLLMMLVGIKFILVGAVFISTYKFGRWGMNSRHPSMREIGLIAASGPFVNLVLAAVFRALSGSAMLGVGLGLGATLTYLATINAWLAFFNLVPVKPLDGSKIFFWNTTAWILLIAVSLLLLTPSHIFGSLFASIS